MAAVGGHRRHGRGLRALGIPVIGGNVSLYNESGGADIDPTPVVGRARGGRGPGCGARPAPASCAGTALVLLGPHRPASLAGSRWAVERRGHRGGRAARPRPGRPRGRCSIWWPDLVAGGGSAGGRPRRLRRRPRAWPWPSGRAVGRGSVVEGVGGHAELFSEAPVAGGGVHQPIPTRSWPGPPPPGSRPGARRRRRGPAGRRRLVDLSVAERRGRLARGAARRALGSARPPPERPSSRVLPSSSAAGGRPGRSRPSRGRPGRRVPVPTSRSGLKRAVVVGAAGGHQAVRAGQAASARRSSGV